MDTKTKGKIINAIRRLSFTHKPRNAAKAKRKVGPATWQCDMCQAVVYTGKKKDIPSEVTDIYPNAIFGKIEIDHQESCVPLEGFPGKKWDWNIFLDNMFCDEDGFNVICKPCHDSKTFLEKEIRKEARQKNKKVNKKT